MLPVGLMSDWDGMAGKKDVGCSSCFGSFSPFLGCEGSWARKSSFKGELDGFL